MNFMVGPQTVYLHSLTHGRLASTVRLMLAVWIGVSACVVIPPANVDSALLAEAKASSQSLTLWQGKRVPEHYQPGEITQFDLFQAGTLVGHVWSRYDGVANPAKPAQFQFSLKFELLPPDQPQLRSESEVVVDAKGRLVSAIERGSAAEQRILAKIDTLELERKTGLGKPERRSLGFSEESAFLGYLAPIYQELMLVTRNLVEGQQGWRVINISTFEPLEWTGEFSEHDGDLEIRTGLGEVLTVHEGRLTAIEISDSQLELLKSIAPVVWPDWHVDAPRSLRYQPPEGALFRVRSLELSGHFDDPKLVGDLLVPPSGKTPAAGVVFLSASGVTDRYGFAGPPATDLGSHEITDAMAEAGFVVLRYDERGRGESEEALLSWKGQIDDARRAIQTLLVQPEVDPSRIFIVGHGEGGWRGLKLATEFSREVKGVALLAPHGDSYRELMSRSPEVLQSIESGVGVPDALLPYLQWYREILLEDPEQIVRAAPCPIWVAQAEKDFEVDAPRARSAYKKWIQSLSTDRQRSSKVLLFANLDHLFKVEPGESSHERYLVDRSVDVPFLQSLLAWMAQQSQK